MRLDIFTAGHSHYTVFWVLYLVKVVKITDISGELDASSLNAQVQYDPEERHSKLHQNVGNFYHFNSAIYRSLYNECLYNNVHYSPHNTAGQCTQGKKKAMRMNGQNVR
jgi:hypothetical protein